MHVGTSIREDNGDLYKWVIGCGVLIEGSAPEILHNPGTFSCSTIRHGAGFTNTEGGLMTYALPCPILSSLQCECAPEGTQVEAFGIPSPSGSCRPEDNCPFSCSDQEMDARTLCRSFPGHVRWFEGENPSGKSFFFSWYLWRRRL